VNGLKATLAQVHLTRFGAQLDVVINQLSVGVIAQKDLAIQLMRDARSREENLLARQTELLREVYETIAEVRVTFQMTDHLKTKIQAVESFRTTNISPPEVKGPITMEALRKRELELRAELPKRMTETILKPFDELLPLLHAQVLAARAALTNPAR
jgi:hypothetical protein